MPRPATETALTIHHLIRAAERAGLERRVLLEAADLDPADVGTFEVRVPIERVCRAWEVAMRHLRDPGLPVRAAQVPRSEGRSSLALLLSSSATLRDALPRLANYGTAVTDAFAWRWEEGRDATTFVFDAPAPRTLGERCHIEYHTADGVHSVRQWTHTMWQPLRVAFQHAAPLDVREHVAHFGAPLVWGAPRTEVVLPRSVLELPLVTASGALTELLERQLRAHADRARTQRTLAASLKLALLADLEAGTRIDGARAARRLGVSLRTLHRRLAAESTTFQRVLDETRREIAGELLASPDARMKDVSFALGFSDTRAFRRAYRRWTGKAAPPT
jgi:AraC-like DNA-binding protein